MKNIIFERTMENIAHYDTYMVNVRTKLLDLERLHKPIEIHTFSRRFLDKYKCVDTPNKPILLDSFTLHGGLIYYKKNRFEWLTISFDEIQAIYS